MDMMITKTMEPFTVSNNLQPNQKIPPSVRKGGAKLNEEAKLHFL